MSDNSNIEWTDASWNFASGCDKIGVGRGCHNCYAIRMSHRLARMGNDDYKGVVNDKGDDWTGVVKFAPHKLDKVVIVKKPKLIFVNSMGDLFHKKITTDQLDAAFDIMESKDHHQFQILTKRPTLMRDYINNRYNPDNPCPRNIWLGVSIAGQQEAAWIPHLINTRAKVKWLSIEPLIDPLTLPDDIITRQELSWVVVGGESGKDARRMESAWVRVIRNYCRHNLIPLFFKQWGDNPPAHIDKTTRFFEGNLYDDFPFIKADYEYFDRDEMKWLPADVIADMPSDLFGGGDD